MSVEVQSSFVLWHALYHRIIMTILHAHWTHDYRIPTPKLYISVDIYCVFKFSGVFDLDPWIVTVCSPFMMLVSPVWNMEPPQSIQDITDDNGIF